MSSTLYKLYRDKVITLASTMVVHVEEFVNIINTRKVIEERGFSVDPNNPQSWKYYLNLAGFYHDSDLFVIAALNGYANSYRGVFQTPMQLQLQHPTAALNDTAIVRATPTSEMLTYKYNGSGWVFTNEPSPATMLIKVASDSGPVNASFSRYLVDPAVPYLGDVAIANEYRYNSDYYNELVTRYPDFEELILGILYPVEFDVAYNSKTGDILHCGGYFRKVIQEGVDHLGKRITFLQRQDEGRLDEGLIESNEVDIIFQLEDWIKGIYNRWNNSSYNYTDDLYATVFCGDMFNFLVKRIMNLRKENCHTPKAHSYHIQEFLESHGKLARYIPYLPLAQTLYLYRNVRYIERNIGKQSTFNMLVDNILTPAGIPLAGFSLRHNLSNQPTNLLPEVELEREVINFEQVGAANDTIKVLELLLKEEDQGRENRYFHETIDVSEETAVLIEQRDQTAWSDRLPVKVMESSMLDYSDRLPYTLEDILVNHWVFAASNGNYTGTVFVTHPDTGDRFYITPRNAFILFFYCMNKIHANVTLTNIPKIVARVIPKSTTGGPLGYGNFPTLADLKDEVSSDEITDADLNELIGVESTNYNDLFAANTADKFYRNCKKIHATIMRRYYKVAKTEDVHARGQMQNAFERMYWHDIECTLSNIATYEEWFDVNGIDISMLTTEQLTILAADLLKYGTGNLDDSSLRQQRLQEAAIAIMRQFSSYNVQYIYNNNNREVLLVDPKTIRITNLTVNLSTTIHVPIPAISVVGMQFQNEPALLTIPTTLEITLSPELL